MRIACIAASSVPSLTANSIQVMKVTDALARSGHEVRLWLPGSAPEQAWEVITEQYGVAGSFQIRWNWSPPALRRYEFSLRAIAAARLWGADLFYVWPLQAAAFAASLGFPTLAELHDRPTGRLGPRLLGRFLAGRGAVRLVCTTEALLGWVKTAYGTDLEPPFGLVAPNGYSSQGYQDLPTPEEARRRLELPESFTAGYTGHLYPGRGTALMQQLARRNPDISFVWAGGEPEAVEEWRERVSRDGPANLYLHGFVPNAELPLFQAACDVLLMPYGLSIDVSSSQTSGAFASPMKLFEYLASGRPILSSDLTILHEILNTENAVLLPPGGLQAWDEALKELAADPAKCRRLGEAARRTAEPLSWERRAARALEGLRGA